ncbi:hypothetical protein [Actinomycetospora aeridis]|uniref:Uncharacterized protein n=1 Tax=Actinomycetospora aeridis TaxID=3129231 RepID=A0ABU8NCB9_9PSEU
MTGMTATPDAAPEPMAALPLLAEAGVSVYWIPLEGRTAWVADAATRQVWISRAVPREALLGCLIEALQVLDEHQVAPDLRLVHSTDRVVEDSDRRPPELGVVAEA